MEEIEPLFRYEQTDLKHLHLLLIRNAIRSPVCGVGGWSGGLRVIWNSMKSLVFAESLLSDAVPYIQDPLAPFFELLR